MHGKLSIVLSLALLSAPLHAKDEMQQAREAMNKGDYAIAYCLLKPLAEDDNVEAQYQLGWMYHNGYGLAVDDAKAAYWWEKAADEDVAGAQMALTMLYREGGRGVKQNLPRAAKFLLTAAQSGDDEARMLLSHYLDDPDWALERRMTKIMSRNPESLGPVIKVTVDKANLRSAPGTTSSVIDTVPTGEKLILLARRGEWAHAIYLRKRKVVWLHGELIKVTADSTKN